MGWLSQPGRLYGVNRYTACKSQSLHLFCLTGVNHQPQQPSSQERFNFKESPVSGSERVNVAMVTIVSNKPVLAAETR